jgi:hypothetical protein
MLTLDEACNIAAQVTCPYLPALQIDIGHSNHYKDNEFKVTIRFEVFLTHNRSITKPLHSVFLFQNTIVHTGYDLLMSIRDGITYSVTHEVYENLRFDNMFIYDPHPGLYQYPVINKEMFRF